MPKRTDILPNASENMSPMMRQYIDIKKQHLDCILFFRLGDFYEMFYNDAEVASEELDLTLTKRANGEEGKAPMCGVPFHSCEGYISRLIKKGYRVAICEQTEDPAKTKKLVKRDVIRIVTPGTVTDDAMLDSGKNNYLATVFVNGDDAGMCFVDVSTGEVHLTARSSKQLSAEIVNELSRFAPREVLLNNAAAFDDVVSVVSDRLNARLELLSDEQYCNDDKIATAKKHFRVDDFHGFGIEDDSPSALALCCAVDFLIDTQKNDLAALNEIDLYGENEYMRLDIAARNNLELCETMRSHDKKGSLLWVLDHTKTPMGKRMIANWLELPLLSPAKITKRQNAVAELVSKHEVREELGESLKQIADLERLITRAVYGTANARDLLSLGETLERLPFVKAAVRSMNSGLLCELHDSIDELTELSENIRKALVDEPPLSVREGGLIRDGFDEQVDSLRHDMSGGKGIVSDIENRERERTGVKKLRIVYNRVFGYLIEVPNSAGDFTVPDEYIRRQTLTNCERYSTDEVKQLEGRILGAQDKLVALEYELFVKLRQTAGGYAESIKKTAASVAQLDTLWSLAMTAYKNDYICPDISVDGKIEIKEGRHPVVEQLSSEPFVPNDTVLDNGENRCAIITGPNMAGKSTYMRQTAIICIMAQMGSFVPAKSAKCGIVDAIFTRVGASDDLTAGKSTFMVEMSEVANILKYATKNSLLIVDEIGRGTSTYDGMAIARAVLEYVADRKKLGAKALFATHYHELTVLEETLDGVKNYNIAAKKRKDEIIFLRRIVRGGADESYGIEVASLAGVPHDVVLRAKAILKSLEADGMKPAPKPKEIYEQNTEQISFSSTQKDELCDELKKLDINTLTPIEAMQKLNEIVAKAKKI